MTFILTASQNLYAKGNNGGNNKPQPEGDQKEVNEVKYTFTLFNFFTTSNAIKPDSSGRSTKVINTADRKEN